MPVSTENLNVRAFSIHYVKYDVNAATTGTLSLSTSIRIFGNILEIVGSIAFWNIFKINGFTEFGIYFG